MLLSLPLRASGLTYADIVEQAIWDPAVPADNLFYDSGQLTQTTLSHFLSGSGPTGIANVTGSIGDGQIHGFAESVSSGAQANFGGMWSDSIIVGGLPDGTRVSLLLTLSLDSNVSAVQSGSAALASSILTVFLGGNERVIGLQNTTTDTIDGLQTTSMRIDCFTGPLSCFTFIEQLGLTTRSVGQDSQAIADALNTNFINIDVLTPGGTITSASGIGYASTTSTPEPATAAPALAVLAGFLLVRKVFSKVSLRPFDATPRDPL
jgi:hypothetical protein